MKNKNGSVLIKKINSCTVCPMGHTVIENVWLKCNWLKIDIYEPIIPKECPLRVNKILVKLE